MSHQAIDTSGFTTAEEFREAQKTILFPKRPQKPENRVKGISFGSEPEYLRALAQAHEDFEKENASFEEKRNEYRNLCKQLEEDFYEFCANELLDDAIPDSVKRKVYAVAYESGHSSGFSEIYSSMADISELVESAFFAGQASVSQ